MEQTQWDWLLIACIQKDWQHLTKEEKAALYERRAALNKGFLDNESNIVKLRKLNDILHKREAAIHAHANRVRKMQKEWLEHGLIIDYEIDVELELWSSSYDRLHPDFEGNPFYQCSLSHFGHNDEDADPAFINDNWNEFEHCPNHPLSKDFHCYTFHHIDDHTCLSWMDIVNVEDVWIEINVSNQFSFNIVNR